VIGGGLIDWINAKRDPRWTEWRSEQNRHVYRPLLPWMVGAMVMANMDKLLGDRIPSWVGLLTLAASFGLMVGGFWRISRGYPYWNESFGQWRKRKDAEQRGVRLEGEPPEWQG
jgi:hypothetical protein